MCVGQSILDTQWNFASVSVNELFLTPTEHYDYVRFTHTSTIGMFNTSTLYYFTSYSSSDYGGFVAGSMVCTCSP